MVQSGLHKPERLRALRSLISCALFFVVAPPPAAAQFKAWVMGKLPDKPEGLGVDSQGDVFAQRTSAPKLISMDLTLFLPG